MSPLLIPQEPQSTAPLKEQLMDLRIAAKRLGLYDAMDFLDHAMGKKETPNNTPSMPAMVVLEIPISHTQVYAAVERMRHGPFFASDLEELLIQAGVPKESKTRGGREHIAHRVADRLIQKHRAQLELVARSPKPTWLWKNKGAQ